MHEHASRNRAYRTVFNAALGAMVAVPETARGHGASAARTGTPGAVPLRRLAFALAVALAFAGPRAWALDPATLPRGGQVAAGQAEIATAGTTMTVRQASQRAIVNWQSFDLGSGAAVRFVQPAPSAVILNRVQSGAASQILGRMDANANVYVVNPAGVLFGRTAQVHVGGLTASTLQIADEDFLAGRDRFTFAGREGTVVNEGVIRVGPGGRIALLGARVENRGELVAPGGDVALAAGRQVTLAIGAKGHLQVAVDEAQVAALVANGGLVAADGGQVILTAKGAGALASSVVSNTGTLQARTVDGRAGRIVLLADMDAGRVEAGGTLDASAPAGGDGGFIETSAARVKVAPDLRVSTAAPHGATGTWLIDPPDYTIAASGGDMTGTQLSTFLATSNVAILSSSGANAAGNGDIHVDDAVGWNANTLTLTAARDININAVMTAGGTSALVLDTATTNGGSTGVAGGTVKVGLGPTGFRGRVDFPGRSGTGFLTINGFGYTVIDALGSQGSTTGTDLQGIDGALAGRFALGSNIDASATSLWNAGAGFSPIGGVSSSFTGTLEGLGHTIDGLTIHRVAQTETAVGLFSTTSGTIRNVGLEGGSVTSDAWSGLSYRVGALAGVASGTIVHAYGTAAVKGQYNVGGLVGLLGAGGRIVGSQASGTVDGTMRVGGLVGSVGTNTSTTSPSITNSRATGTVTGDSFSSAIGGLVGFNDGFITTSHAEATVYGLGSVGGLVGDNNRRITFSHAGGTVTGEQGVGGLVGFNYNSGRILDSHAGATVEGVPMNCCGVHNTGGLVGYNLGGRIANSYAEGTVTGVNNVGGLVGQLNGGAVDTSYATATVTGTQSVGGLAGWTTGAIRNSYATGTVTGNDAVGGLVGLADPGTNIANTYANNAVTGSSNVGGLVGSRPDSTTPVTNSFWNTDVNPESGSGAGTGRTAAEMLQAGSFTGWDIATTGGTTRMWRIYEGSTAPLLRGLLTPLTLTPAYDGSGAPLANATDYIVPAGTDTSRILGTPQHLLLSSSGAAGNYLASIPGLYSNQSGYDILATPRTIVTPGSAAGDVRLDNPISWTSGTVHITAANNVDLNGQALASASGTLSFDPGNEVRNAGSVAVNLFDLQGGTWNQVAGTLPSFVATDFRIAGGTFLRAQGGDGSAASPYRLTDIYGVQGVGSTGMTDRNHVLANDIDASGTATWNAGAGFAPVTLDAAGVFDGQGHTIDLLRIERPAEGFVGLFSFNQGTVANLGLVGGQVTGGSDVGAIAGYSAGVLDNVYSTATVNGTNWVGGLVGSNAGQVVDSHATGPVTGSSIAGGLAGSNHGSILRSHATGAVHATHSSAGGLAGENEGTIEDSYATGNVLAEEYAAGGLVGRDLAGSITRSYATGRAEAVLQRAGGLVGHHFGAISDSYATGGATGGDYVGGLVGYAGDGSSVADSYATGVVSGGVVGGLVGARQSTAAIVSGSHWDTAGTGLSSSDGGTGVDAAAMRQQATFAGWDFSGTWILYEGHTRPLLRSFMTPITVTANDATKTYDGQAYDGSAGLSYSAAPDPARMFGTPGYTSGLNAGTHAITPGGLYSDQQGYAITFTDGTLTVDRKALTVAGMTARDKVYNGNDGAQLDGGALVGLVGSETLGLSGGTGVFTGGKNVGDDKAVTVSGLALVDGTGLASNYSFTPPAGLTADITQRTLTVDITGVDKVYDGTRDAFVTLDDDRVLNDALVLSHASPQFADKNVGSAKPFSVTGLTLGGADAGNYTLATTGANVTANITPRPLNVTAFANSRGYNGTRDATVGFFSADLLGGDFLTYAGTGLFDDKNAGTAKTVTISGFTLGGADAGNYAVVATPNTATADILRRNLSVFFLRPGKEYDRTTAADLVIAGDSRVAGDTLVVTHGSATYDDRNAGFDKTVTITGLALSGTDAGNYNLAATATHPGDIFPRTLTVGASGQGKEYDGGTAATVTLTDNRIAGDQLVIAHAGASFLDRHAGVAKPVIVSGIDMSGTDAGNYVLAHDTAGAQADITPRLLDLAASGIDKVYDRSDAATVTYSDDRLAIDSISIAGTARFDDRNAGAGKAVSVTGLAILGLDAGNYRLAGTTLGTVATITPRPLAVDAFGIDRTYDGGTAASVSFQDDRLPGDAFTVSSAPVAFADRHAGTGKPLTVTGIAIAGADAGNYAVSNTTAVTEADILRRSLFVFAGGVDKVYDGGTAATVTFGDTRVAGDVLTVTGSARYGDKNVGAGKAISVTGVAIGGADADNYTLSSAPVNTAAAITPRSLDVGATGVDKVYDGTTAAAVNFTDDRVAGDVLSFAGSASFGDKNVGAGKAVAVSGIALSGVDAGNYAFNTTTATTAAITPRGLTVTANGQAKVYDGTTAASVTYGDDRVAGDMLAFSGTATFGDKNVGTGKGVSVTGIAVTGADAGNYAFNTAATTTTADITPRALTITATGQDKVYDGTTAAAVTYGDDRVAGDVLAFSGTANFGDKNAGTGKAVGVTGIAVGGADAGNYTFNTATATTATVTPRSLDVRATGFGKVYDGTTAATVSFTDDRVAGDVLAFSGTAAYGDKNVGTGKALGVTDIAATGADAGNYTFNTATTTTADITRRALAVTAAGQDKVYDGTTAASVTYGDDRVAGDVLAFSGSAAFGDKNVGTAKAVVVTGIAVSGADAGNYSFDTAASTTASITPRALDVTATGQAKVYDGTTAATVTYGDDRVAGDMLVISGTATFGDKNVGTAKAVGVTGIAAGGADAGNYTFNTTASAAASITPRALAVTATGVDKVYDGTTAAVVTYGDDRVAGDVLAFSGTATFGDKNVGAGKAVGVTGIGVTGADAGNYAFNTATASTAAITPRTLNVDALGVDKVYDGTTTASVHFTDDRVAGDLLAFAGEARFADKNVGAGKAVGVASIALLGADAGNYALANTTAAATAAITPRLLTATAVATAKVYDGSVAASVTFTDDRVAGDALEVTGSGSFADRHAGTGKTVSATAAATGADAGNYSLAPVADTTGDITPRTLSGTITAAAKTYDGTTTATTAGTLSGVLAGDTVTLSTSGSFADRHAGTGKTVDVAGALGGVDAADYALQANATTTADITPRALTVTAAGHDKVYDGTVAATATYGDDRVAGDVLAITGTATFGDRNVGTGKAVAITGIAVTGADAGNYAFNTAAATNASITRAPLLVIVEDLMRLSDGLPFFGGGGVRLAGLAPGDDATVLAGTPTWGGTAQGATLPGRYTLSVANYSAYNYDLRYLDGSLTLSPRQDLRASGEILRQAQQDAQAPVIQVEGGTAAVRRRVPLTIAPDFLRTD